MAEDSGKDAKAGEPKKKSKLGLIIGIVVGLLVLGGGGGFAYMTFFAGGDKAGAAEASTGAHGEEAGAAGAGAAPGAMFPLDAFVVNLSETSARRYLKATISLEFGAPPKDEEISKKMPQIRDAVIVLLSSKSLEDVASTQGKIQIRKEIMHRVNRIVGEPPVRGVYYTEFVIQ